MRGSLADIRRRAPSRFQHAAWTYFGNAFFNQALRRTADLQAAYTEAVELVTAREQREGFTPSYPQFSGGSGVLAHLRGR